MYGMPAYPRLVTVNVNGTRIPVYLHGDENHKRMETIDGYTVRQNDEGVWCYAVKGSDGNIQPTKWSIDEDKSMPELATFLNNTQKHLHHNYESNKPKDYQHVKRNTDPVIGTRRILVILMSFQDYGFSKAKEEFNDLFNKRGYDSDGAYGSVVDYYNDVSYGKLKLHCDIYGIYLANKNMKYYGGNGKIGGDKAPEELFKEAIASVYNDIEDWSLYDSDNDGIIDNVHIIFAGYGEEAGADEDAIWSHELTFLNNYEYRGIKFDRYSCAPELRGNKGKGISRIGPHCHEIGHALGALDYYDTDYSTGGEFEGTGQWDLMAAGSWNNDGVIPADFNPYVKTFNFGWVTPKTFVEGDNTVPPSIQTDDGYYIIGYSDNSDFYLLENRSKDQWGQGLPGEGLLVYHVHKDIENVENEINAKAPQKCYIVCASSQVARPGTSPSSYGAINSTGCPFPGTSDNHEFGRNTIPQAFYWESETCTIELSCINIGEDKNIHLNYNSQEEDNSEQTTYKTVFFEDFEGDLTVSILEESDPKWKQTNNSNDLTNIKDGFNAYEGERCLLLSAKDATKTISSTIVVNIPNFEEGHRYIVSMYTSSYYSNMKKKNTLQIRFMTESNPEWEHRDFPLSGDGKWIEITSILPNDITLPLYIVGFVDPQSLIAIDNIIIEREDYKEDSKIRDILDTNSHSIYSITGIKQIQLGKGIYILKKADGKVIKTINSDRSHRGGNHGDSR